MAKKETNRLVSFTTTFDKDKLGAMSVAERKNTINQQLDDVKEKAIAYFTDEPS